MIYVVSKEIKVKDQDPIKAGTVYVGKEQALEKERTYNPRSYRIT